MDEEVETMEPAAPAPEESGTQQVDAAQEEATASGEEVAGEGQESPAEPTAEASEQKRPSRGVQKRLDELTREKYEWKREAEYWRDAFRQRAQLAQPNEVPQTPIAAEAEPKGKPNPDDYDDYNAYIEALTDWKAREVIRAEQLNTLTRQLQAVRQAEEARLQQIVDKSIAAARQKYADFDEVVGSLNIRWSNQAIKALKEIPNGAEIVYYLGAHPDEAEQIAHLSPEGQIREVGKLEYKLLSMRPPEPKRITRTNEPPKIVSGAGVTEKDPNKMGMEEYAAWRMAQERS